MTKTELYKLIIYRLMLSVLHMIKSLTATIPLGICSVVITMLILKTYENKTKTSINSKKRKTIILLVLYMVVLIQIVFLLRPWGGIRQIDLIPFNTPGGTGYIILYALANAVIFFPIGILLPGIWRKMNSLKAVLLAGFACSVVIEVSQLILACGVFQTEDLIMNTLGAGMGYWLYRKKHSENTNNI